MSYFDASRRRPTQGLPPATATSRPPAAPTHEPTAASPDRPVTRPASHSDPAAGSLTPAVRFSYTLLDDSMSFADLCERFQHLGFAIERISPESVVVDLRVDQDLKRPSAAMCLPLAEGALALIRRAGFRTMGAHHLPELLRAYAFQQFTGSIRDLGPHLPRCWAAVLVRQAWTDTQLQAVWIREGLRDSEGRQPPIAPELRAELQAAALRIDLAKKFAGAVFPIGNNHPNEAFRSLAQSLGAPAAMRIAYHHRMTTESPVWRHMFPDPGELPEAYARDLERYDRAIRAWNPDWESLAKASDPMALPTDFDDYPMNAIADKLGQDRRLCDQLIELAGLEIQVVEGKLTSLSARQLSASELQLFDTLCGQRDELKAKLTSLGALHEALRSAEAAPKLQDDLKRHGYVRLLNEVASPDLASPRRARLEVDQLAAVLRFQNEIQQVRIGALQQQLGAPRLTEEDRAALQTQVAAFGDELLERAQNVEALEFGRDSGQLKDLLASTAHTIEEAMGFARTAWLVTKQAEMDGQTDPTAVFDAVLCWIRLTEEEKLATHAEGSTGTADDPDRWIAAARPSAAHAIRAFEGYEQMLTIRIARLSVEDATNLRTLRDSIQALRTSIQAAVREARSDRPGG